MSIFMPYLLLRLAVFQIRLKHLLSHPLTDTREWLNASPFRMKCYHSTAWIAHSFYFLFVFIEGHGTYAMMAGFCLTITLASPFFGEGE